MPGAFLELALVLISATLQHGLPRPPSFFRTISSYWGCSVFNFIFINVHVCVCMCACATCVLAPTGSRRRCWSPWNWRQKVLSRQHACWEPKPGPLEVEQVCLTAALTFQTVQLFIFPEYTELFLPTLPCAFSLHLLHLFHFQPSLANSYLPFKTHLSPSVSLITGL